MKSVSFTDRLYSIKTTNRFGRPNGLGFITCGVSMLGEDNEMAGIYQQRNASKYKYDELNSELGVINLGYSKLGSRRLKKTDNQFNHKITCRLRHYVPTNPRTESQQTWRQYFALVLNSWQSLTAEEKKAWNTKTYPAHMTGWNRFASYHLTARDL